MGSSNYITNIAGDVSQHMEYFAFGETFVEEHKNSINSPYKFNGKELDEESGLYYYGARYYDPRLSIWASVDPLVEETMDAYGYCYQNPINYFEPDGCSPISVLLKQMLKYGAKQGLREFAERQIKKRIMGYMKHLKDESLKNGLKNLSEELAKDIEKILGELDSEWWERAIELIPIAGDAYGTTKFGIKLKRAYDKMQDLENNVIGKLDDLLPKSLKEDLRKKMRRIGINDAKIDQKAGARVNIKDEEIYVKTNIKDPIKNRIEGHHTKSVSIEPKYMTDPRYVRFKTQPDHKKIHGKKVSRSPRFF